MSKQRGGTEDRENKYDAGRCNRKKVTFCNYEQFPLNIRKYPDFQVFNLMVRSRQQYNNLPSKGGNTPCLHTREDRRSGAEPIGT